MKISAHVTSVEDNGDKLKVTMQGKADSEGGWAAMAWQIVSLPNNSKTRRAFYVGREVRLNVKPSL